MSLTNFRLSEVKEYDRDVKCITELLKLVKNGPLDSNIVYELCYYQDKFKKWLSYGIMDTVVRIEIVWILDSLEELLQGLDEKELERAYKGHEWVGPMYAYDKLKYQDTERPLKTTYIRDFYTEECQKLRDDFYMELTQILIYTPLIYSFGLIVLILFSVFVSDNSFILSWIWSGLCALYEFSLCLDAIYKFYRFLGLRCDSLESWYTGKYKKQQRYDYHYTLRGNKQQNGQYVYDKVGEMLDYLSVNYGYNESMLWDRVYKTDSVLDRFKVLASKEVDAYYAHMEKEQEYADNMGSLVLDSTQFGAEW